MTRSAPIAILLLLLLTACGDSAVSTEPTMLTPPTPTELTIGDTGESGGVKVTVDDVRRRTEGFNAPKEGMQYILVTVTIDNGTDESQPLHGQLSMQVKDATSQNDVTTFAPATAEGPGPQVPPRTAVHDEIGYEAPITATELVFIYTPLTSGEPLRFKLDP